MTYIPDQETVYEVGVSGGKDSVALWLHMKYDLNLRVIPVFADTGWEHELTYKHLDYLKEKIGPIEVVKPDLDFVDLVKKKHRFPSRMMRYCTQHLKLVPTKRFIDKYIEEHPGQKVVMCAGVRAEESAARAAMAEYVEHDEFYKLPQWRPILSWTWQQVFDIHRKYDVKPNPLYKKGMGRVGCMPCVMANKYELSQIAKEFPEVFDKVEEAEKAVSAVSKLDYAAFWPSQFLPDEYCSLEHVGKDGRVHKVPSAQDVKRYVLERAQKYQDKKAKQMGEYASFADFEEPENEDIEMCSSIYGLCE